MQYTILSKNRKKSGLYSEMISSFLSNSVFANWHYMLRILENLLTCGPCVPSAPGGPDGPNSPWENRDYIIIYVGENQWRLLFPASSEYNPTENTFVMGFQNGKAWRLQTKNKIFYQHLTSFTILKKSQCYVTKRDWSAKYSVSKTSRKEEFGS